VGLPGSAARSLLIEVTGRSSDSKSFRESDVGWTEKLRTGHSPPLASRVVASTAGRERETTEVG
jgi:hypothetical protein